VPPLLAALAGAAYLLLPLLGGAAVHGVCMRQGWLAFLARPIDADRRWRGRPIFGHSKTFRGPLCVAAGAGAVLWLQQGPLHRIEALAALEWADYAGLPGWLGASAGAAAELSELPNSFVKRRLGIAPGRTAQGPLAAVFYLWDQLDLLLGWWLVMASAVPATPARVGASALVAVSIHPLLTLAGYLLGMRPTAR
jgi:CDP-2,3-bis-(O-geranylgeranyl)-sn-glycerol synthase